MCLQLNCTRGYNCGLLNIAMHGSVLSCNEQHKHLHLNVHYGSQLKISRVCLKAISSLHYNLSGNTNVTVVITLKGLREDDHSGLITGNDKLLRAVLRGSEEGQEASDGRIGCMGGRKGRSQTLPLSFCFYYGKFVFCMIAMNQSPKQPLMR